MKKFNWNAASNSASIGRAIEFSHGVKGIKVCSKGGCCRFYSDNKKLGLILSGTDAVMVCYMNQLALDSWVDEFETAVKQQLDVTMTELKAAI